MRNLDNLTAAACSSQPRLTNGLDELHLMVGVGESCQRERCTLGNGYDEMRREITHLVVTIKALSALLVTGQPNQKPAPQSSNCDGRTSRHVQRRQENNFNQLQAIVGTDASRQLELLTVHDGRDEMWYEIKHLLATVKVMVALLPQSN